MDGVYHIWLGKETVGQAAVSRQGLYYCFDCRCRLHSKVMCKVTVSCGGHHENLGILAPCGKDYALNRRIPVKQFPAGTPEFWITPKQTGQHEIRVDVYPEEPFRYIAKLEKAYLDRSAGGSGICIGVKKTGCR